MHTFSWTLPEASPGRVTLTIHSYWSWFGRKILELDGQRVYTRGYFEGPEGRFAHPSTGEEVRVRLLTEDRGAHWRPALYFRGEELPEQTGNSAPEVVQRPKAFGVITGVTLLAVFVAAVTLLSTVKILNAMYLRHDDCRYVLTIVDSEAEEAPPLALKQMQLPAARIGEEYRIQLEPIGGIAPYSYAALPSLWSRELTLDEETGELTGTPLAVRDLSGKITIKDANDQEVTIPINLPIEGATTGEDGPRVLTTALPVVKYREEYEFTLEATGGKPPYSWEMLKYKLPKGLELESETGRIHGTLPKPEKKAPEADSAEEQPSVAPTEYHIVGIRVIDDTYHVGQSIWPWVIPCVVTVLAMAGYWNMQRWAVIGFAVLIAGQWILYVTNARPLAMPGLVAETILLLPGLVYYRRMR